MNLTLDGVKIYDPHTYEGMEDLVQAFVERRKGKATEEQARKALLDENYFGTMLVYKGLADGLVSGAATQLLTLSARLFKSSKQRRREKDFRRVHHGSRRRAIRIRRLRDQHCA